MTERTGAMGVPLDEIGEGQQALLRALASRGHDPRTLIERVTDPVALSGDGRYFLHSLDPLVDRLAEVLGIRPSPGEGS